jgi:hypothetical protein
MRCAEQHVLREAHMCQSKVVQYQCRLEIRVVQMTILLGQIVDLNRKIEGAAFNPSWSIRHESLSLVNFQIDTTENSSIVRYRRDRNVGHRENLRLSWGESRRKPLFCQLQCEGNHETVSALGERMLTGTIECFQYGDAVRERFQRQPVGPSHQQRNADVVQSNGRSRIVKVTSGSKPVVPRWL